MKCIDLNSATQDLRIVDRRFVLEPRFGYALALRIRNAISVVKGEWALNEDAGFPYYPHVFGNKSPDLGIVRSLFVAYIEAIEGVALCEIACEIIGRTLDVSGFAIADDGSRVEIVNGNVYVDGVKV